MKYQPVMAQFHVFEGLGGIGLVGQSGGDALFSAELNYCYQRSSRHGLGLKVGWNRPIVSILTSPGGYYPKDNFGATYDFRNPGFPTLGILYRYHFKEGIYFEAAISTGGWKEEFKLDRTESYSYFGVANEVHYASEYRCPAIKFEPVFGFKTIRNRVFFVFRTGLAMVHLSQDIHEYVRISTSATTTYVFRPTSGTFFFWNTSIGLGFRK